MISSLITIHSDNSNTQLCKSIDFKVCCTEENRGFPSFSLSLKIFEKKGKRTTVIFKCSPPFFFFFNIPLLLENLLNPECFQALFKAIYGSKFSHFFLCIVCAIYGALGVFGEQDLSLD